MPDAPRGPRPPPETTPRCRDCFYVLAGLPAGLCPECGRSFDLDDPRTYTLKPPLVRWRLWLPGFALAALSGFLLWLLLLPLGTSVGWGATIAVPLAIGGLIGYRCRVGVFYLVLLVIGALLITLAPLVMMSVVGLLCGAMAAVVVIVPAGVGAALGWALRTYLKGMGYHQAAWLPVVALLLLPPAVTLLESIIPRNPVVVAIATSRLIEADPQVTWTRLLFYDQLNRQTPLLFKLGMPRPLRTTGALQRPEDTQTCLYDKGSVRKRLLATEPGRRLAFEVIEQRIGLERSVRLAAGRFDLQPADGGRTRLTLTTEYEALLRPRFAWRPAEGLCVHAVHDCILDGIEAQAEREMLLAGTGAPR